MQPVSGRRRPTPPPPSLPSQDVAAAACGALCNVAATPEARVAVVQAGGVAALIAVLARRDATPAVLRPALTALQAVAGAAANKGPMAREPGAVAGILRVLLTAAEAAEAAATTAAAMPQPVRDGSLTSRSRTSDGTAAAAGEGTGSVAAGHVGVVEAACGVLQVRPPDDGRGGKASS